MPWMRHDGEGRRLGWRTQRNVPVLVWAHIVLFRAPWCKGKCDFFVLVDTWGQVCLIWNPDWDNFFNVYCVTSKMIMNSWVTEFVWLFYLNLWSIMNTHLMKAYEWERQVKISFFMYFMCLDITLIQNDWLSLFWWLNYGQVNSLASLYIVSPYAS